MSEPRSDYEHLMAVSNATTLLVQAARISPPLIAAARLVDQEIHALRDEIDRLRKALRLIADSPPGVLVSELRAIAQADLFGRAVGDV